MRLKLDENLGMGTAELLRQAGRDVATVPEQGMRGSPDRALIEACQREGRCLVTLDLDFGNPFLFNPSDYAGIAVIRLPQRSTPDDLHDGVQTLIGAIQQESVEGNLWIVQRGRIRQYQPEEEAEDG